MPRIVVKRNDNIYFMVCVIDLECREYTDLWVQKRKRDLECLPKVMDLDVLWCEMDQNGPRMALLMDTLDERFHLCFHFLCFF